MHGWGLLVWAVAYLGLKETAGDTVNSRGSGWPAWGVGGPVTPPPGWPQQPGVWEHSLIEAFVLDLQ